MRARVGLPMVKSRSANMTSTIGDKISYSLVVSRHNGLFRYFVCSIVLLFVFLH